MDDYKLLATGDNIAFRRLFEKHYPSLLEVCRVAFSNEISKNIIVEVFSFVWVERRNLGNEDAFIAFFKATSMEVMHAFRERRESRVES